MHKPRLLLNELALARQLEEAVADSRFNEVVSLFPRLQESHFSGVGFSAYPEAAFAFDQISRPSDALRVLGLLEARLREDEQKGYGYLAPGRPPRDFLKRDFASFLARLRSEDVKKRIREIVSKLQ